MINTLLLNLAESVSAIASTSVDLPTPPLVFITAMILRIVPHSSPGVPLYESHVVAQCPMWQTPAIPFKYRPSFDAELRSLALQPNLFICPGHYGFFSLVRAHG